MNAQLLAFILFVFDRFAADRVPTEQQIVNAYQDWQKE